MAKESNFVVIRKTYGGTYGKHKNARLPSSHRAFELFPL